MTEAEFAAAVRAKAAALTEDRRRKKRVRAAVATAAGCFILLFAGFAVLPGLISCKGMNNKAEAAPVSPVSVTAAIDGDMRRYTDARKIGQIIACLEGLDLSDSLGAEESSRAVEFTIIIAYEDGSIREYSYFGGGAILVGGELKEIPTGQAERLYECFSELSPDE